MPSSLPASLHIAFIGGGNMANAIIRGLVQDGFPGSQITVVAPTEGTRTRLAQDFGVQTLATADASLQQADVVVWAVKPQVLREAAQPVVAHTLQALHVSVAAGIPLSTLEQWLQSRRLVRCMPNTPAQIGMGMAGMVAGSGASHDDRALADALMAPTGARMWVDTEQQLDGLMAISGSGPAYVFLWIEALMQGGQELGLSASQSRLLAAQTLAGAAALVLQSDTAPETLRQQVTSKGGVTHEAIRTMRAAMDQGRAAVRG